MMSNGRDGHRIIRVRYTCVFYSAAFGKHQVPHYYHTSNFGVTTPFRSSLHMRFVRPGLGRIYTLPGDEYYNSWKQQQQNRRSVNRSEHTLCFVSFRSAR